MPTPFDPEELLDQPLLAILSSVSAEGAPRNAPVWYIWEDRALWMLADAGNSTVSRLAANPDCAVEITEFDRERGILLHLGLRGRAEILSNDPARFRRLLDRYLGARETWNPWFIETVARPDDPTGRFIRLAPDSIFTNNVSYFRSGPNLAWP